jgi:hypothetical protein
MMRPEARKVGGKVQKVMHEFGSGKLRSSSGQKVTNPKQAIAIALSEQRRAKKYAGGGAIAKQDTQHGRMDMPFKKLSKFAGMKHGGKVKRYAEGGQGGNVESKKMLAKEVAFMKKKGAPKSMLKHEEAEMKGYARGGKIKEVMGPRTMSQDVEGGYKAHKLAHGEHSEQKRGHTRGTVVKMASGGSVRAHGEHSIQKSGHTKGRMV